MMANQYPPPNPQPPPPYPTFYAQAPYVPPQIPGGLHANVERASGRQQYGMYNFAPPDPALLNYARFDANSQHPAALPQFTGSALPPEILKQLAQAGLPLPPPPVFPPLPLTNTGVPPFQQLSSGYPPFQQHINQSNYNAFNHNRAPDTHSTPQAYQAAGKETEPSDGEMADIRPTRTAFEDGIVDDSRDSQRNKGPPRPDMRNQHVSSIVSLPNPFAPEPRAAQVHISHNSHNSSALPLASIDNFLSGRLADNAQHATQPIHTGTNGLSNGHPTTNETSDRNSAHETPNTVLRSNRELAKDALLALLSHGIRYTDLVNEGIDPALLAHLYAEIGVSDKAIEQAPSKTTAMAESSLQAKSAPIKTHNFDRPISSGQVHTTPKNGSSHEVPLGGSQDSSGTVAPKPSSSNQGSPRRSPDTPVVNVEPTVALERKDRIAQLLKAKTGWALPKRNTSENAAAAHPAEQTAILQRTAMATSVPVPKEPVPTSNVHTPEIPTIPTKTPERSAKSKAQTELVRQKLEMLRKSAPQKVHPQSKSGDSSSPIARNVSTGKVVASGLKISSNDEASQVSVDLQSIMAAALGSQITDAVPRHSQNTLTSPSSIPGLFMTSSEQVMVQGNEPTHPYHARAVEQTISTPPVLTPVSETVTTSQDGSQKEDESHRSISMSIRQIPASQGLRKRPLASDTFDDPVPASKRPRESLESVQSHVSNAESDSMSEGEIMDVEDDSHLNSRTEDVTRNHAPSFPVAHPAPPSISPSDERTNDTIPPRSSQQVDTLAEERDTQDLWRAKNLEIETMRKKIAELEQRRQEKRSQSSAPSPQPAVIQSSPVSSGIAQSSSRPVAKFPGYDATNDSPTPLVETPAMRQEALRQKLLKQKAMRGKMPAASLDAQKTPAQTKLAQAQARLAEMKREAERRQAETREAQKREQEIVEEAARLEAQLQSGIEEGDNGFETAQSTPFDATMPVGNEFSNAPPSEIPPTDPALENNALNDTRTEQEHASPDDTSAPGGDAFQMENTAQVINSLVEAAMPGQGSGGKVSSRSDESSSADYEMNEPQSDLEATPPQTESQSFRPEAVPPPAEGTGMDSFSPSLANAMSQSDDIPYDQSVDLDQENSFGELDLESDGSVSMSDSASDDYEPAEPDVEQSLPDAEDSDEYEPRESPPPLLAPTSFNELGDDFNPGEPDEAVEISSSPSLQPSADEAHGSDTVDDEELDLQLPEATLTKLPDTPQLVHDAVESFAENPEPDHSDSRFVRYQSPLTFLKSFRFHPRFTELVPEGYRSLTYSYNIDPKRPVCPTELAGEDCNDLDCEEQHFRQMSLTDEKILMQMSSAADITDKEERDRYVTGLKQVITDMRTKGVKEFNLVADELAAYRRRFKEGSDFA